MYTHALAIYDSLVDEWFSALRPRLSLAVIQPAQFVGRIHSNAATTSAAYGMPHLSGYFEPLASGSRSSVAFTIDPAQFDFGLIRTVYDRVRVLRPHAARWISVWAGGSPFALSDVEASSKLAYSWLWRDLAALGLVDGIQPFV